MHISYILNQAVILEVEVADCVYETQLGKTTVKLSITANNINRQISKKLTGHLRIYFLEPLQGWGKK